MSEEKKIGEARAGFEPEVLTSKAGRRHLSEESRRAAIRSIPLEKAWEIARRADEYERSRTGDEEESAEREQSRAWLAVFDLCRELGMPITLGKTGLQDVSDFITSLTEGQSVVAAAVAWVEADAEAKKHFANNAGLIDAIRSKESADAALREAVGRLQVEKGER